MKKPARTKADLIEIIKKECKNKDTILDVGCGSGKMLLLAEEIGFARIVGFDLKGGAEINLLAWKAEQENMSYIDYCTKVNCELPKYDIRICNYKDFPFQNYTYDCILLNNFLHFIPDEEKFQLIELLHGLLNHDGIILLKVNHNKHIVDTSDTHAINKGGNIWEGKNVWKELRYLVDAENFTSKLRERYLLIDEHYELDAERSVQIVIKKGGQ